MTCMFTRSCIYKFNHAQFLSVPGLAWQTCLKMVRVKLKLLTDNDMLMMIENGTRGGMCNAIHKYTQANNKYMKSYDENNELSFLEYVNANNLYG